MEVKYPFKRGGPVIGVTLRLGIGVHIYPLNAFADVEGPGKAAVVGSPLLRERGKKISPRVCFQKSVNQIGKIFGIRRQLGFENVKSLKFPGLE